MTEEHEKIADKAVKETPLSEKKLAKTPEEKSKERRQRKKTSKIKVSRDEWEKVLEKAQKSDEYFDQFLRLRAEFDNYRKRMNREREEFAKYAAEDLICEIVTVIDHLENAISASRKSEDYKALVEGVEITRKEALRVLNQWGLEEVQALGEKFDPEKHEAIERIDCDEEEGKIVEELRKGYSLKGKLIRPSMVKVAGRSKNEQSDRD